MLAHLKIGGQSFVHLTEKDCGSDFAFIIVLVQKLLVLKMVSNTRVIIISVKALVLCE